MAVFDELDPKRYGAGLDVLAADAEVQLGLHLCRGRETVREGFRAMNAAVGGHHRLHEFWDGGSLKALRGEITVTSSDTGRGAAPAVGHFLDEDENDRTEVRRRIGAFGP